MPVARADEVRDVRGERGQRRATKQRGAIVPINHSVRCDVREGTAENCILFRTKTVFVKCICFAFERKIVRSLCRMNAMPWLSLYAPVPPGTCRTATVHGAPQAAHSDSMQYRRH